MRAAIFGQAAATFLPTDATLPVRMKLGPALLIALLICAVACSRSRSMAEDDAPASRVPDSTKMIALWDWNGIVGTGQSLGVGVEGTPLRATKPSYRNLKLDLGSRLLPAPTDPSSSRLSLVPLREPIRPLSFGYPAPFPGNISGETPHTCMATQITAEVLARSGGKGDYVTVHSVVGESGQGLKVIAKGAVPRDDTGYAYAASLFEVRAIARLARQARRSYGVGAVVLTHGETDADNPDYERALSAFLADYSADLPAITGQARPPQLLLTQQSSCPTEPNRVARSALSAWKASRAHPGEIICAGPRYQYSYARDGVHLDALGYDRLGEKYGQVYFERLVRGVDWRPLEPVRAQRGANLVSVEFHVPVPPLIWDESLPRPHGSPAHPWANGRGFELEVDGVAVPIESVELDGGRVNIRTAALPGGKLVVRYAATSSKEPRPTGTWRWGQLRDSDPFRGALTGTAQPNYAVTFELAVP